VALGYEGWAKLNVNGTDNLMLCTGASIPHDVLRLESNSGYGGTINGIGTTGIGFPHNYDFAHYSGSINFELYAAIITNQLKPWIFDRQKAATVSIQSRKDNINLHTESFWTSINLSTSAGAVVEGSVGFNVLDYTYDQGGDYIGNKVGNEYFVSHPGLGIPSPLFTEIPDLTRTDVMIPFWDTSVFIEGNMVEFAAWNLDFTQDLVTFYACEDFSTPQPPKFLAAGPMTVAFSGDYMFVNTSSWAAEDFINSLYIKIGTETMWLKRLERNSDKDDVVSGDSMTSIAVDYTAYELDPSSPI